METVDYEYLAELSVDTKTGLYNLFITTYNGDQVSLDVFICERKHNMRLDLVSAELYGNTRYVGTLCQLNNILNPFSIKEGDILFWTSQAEADGLLVVPDVIRNPGIEQLLGQVKNDLINALKNRKRDRNRGNYRREEDALPPTVLPTNAPQAVVDNNKIRIAPNLFNNPNTEPAEPAPSVGPLNDIAPAEPESFERVLVNRYIKKIGNS